MSGTLCRHSSPLCLFGGGRWNARGMLLKSIEAHSSSSFLITPLYVGLIAQTFAPSLSLPSTRFGWIFREAGDKKKKGEKVEGIGKKDEREGWLVYFPGQTHIPGLARVPALPRVPGLTRGTFPDAPSPFTPYLRDSEPYRRNKHHVGNNVTANSVSGACTNPNNTDPTASPASSAHLGASSGSSAHQDCYKHSPQHGGESTDPFVGPSRFDSRIRILRIFANRFDSIRKIEEILAGTASLTSPPILVARGAAVKLRANPTHPLLLHRGEGRRGIWTGREGGSAVSRGNSFIPRSGSAPSNST